MRINVNVYNKLFYHGSPNPGIEKFIPRISTHGKKYVYATPNMSETIIYGAKWNDFMIWVASDDFEEIIVERQKGVIESLYKDKKGYIYILDGSAFYQLDPPDNTWDWVSEEPVNIIDCLTINNLYDVVVKKYKIYWYPNRPHFIPDDDSDIVEHAIEIFNMNGDKSLFPYVIGLFPHLKESFDKELQRLNIIL